MAGVLKYLDKKVLSKANKDINVLLDKLVKTNRGGKRNKVLNVESGKLKNAIKTVLIVKGNDEFELNIEAIDYFKYLDKGSDDIKKPWFFTKDLTESKAFVDIIETCYINALRNSIQKITK